MMRRKEPRGWSNPRLRLGAYSAAIARRLDEWDASEFGRRFGRRDPTIWPKAPAEEVPSRMGWIELPTEMAGRVRDLTDFADEVREDGFERVLLLGMGGSSLAPQTMALTFGPSKAYPRLKVLDSTHPAAVGKALGGHDVEKVFFVVSSKSGSTLEPNSFWAYFWELAKGAAADPGQQFCAVTDAGSPLETLAEAHGFRHCFTARPDVGGRYSALTEFGLVPAALAGVPIRRVVERAERMAAACGEEIAASKNPGLMLGAQIGELALAGRDKVTFLPTPSLTAFPAWAEQLIAESTGKIGKGIVPVAGEVAPLAEDGRKDVVLADLVLAGEESEDLDARLAEAEATGTPVIVSDLSDVADLGAEFLRWEIAIAAAGAIIGIDPFDQPDVEMAKELARQAMTGPGGASGAPTRPRADDARALSSALGPWMASARPGDYLAIQAYLAPSKEMDRALEALRGSLRERLRISSTLGYGPRFLHSTGQLHKGGPNTGLFLQIVDTPADDVTVPPGPMTFGRIQRAQADGDAMALLKKGRRLVGVDVGADAVAGLDAIASVVRAPAA